MFKDVEELKSFISWAKKQKITSMRVGEVSVEFAALAHVEEMEQYIKKAISGTMNDEREDDETLFHSSGA